MVDVSLPEGPRLLSIVYISTAVRPFSDPDLVELLRSARATNTPLGITGLLAHRDSRFLQLIEGPDAAVTERFAVIAADTRHAEVVELERTETEQRWFPDWSMAFQPMTDDIVASVPGFSDFFRTDGRMEGVSSRTRAIMHWFRRHPLAAPAT